MRSVLLLLLLGLSFWAEAQPVPCTEDPPEMTSLCQDACIICDIDGFTGRHESDVSGVAPLDFCTVVVHNAQWIAFIAGSEDLSIEIRVSNCQQGFGLEVGLYEGIDCQNFRMVSECWGGTNVPVAQGTARVFSNTEPLVVGQYYYLVMDGAFGDNCDWTFNVLEGSTQVAPLVEAPLIEGPTNTCPEVVNTYTTPGVEGGTAYSWTLDGVEVSTADSLEIDWQEAGLYQLCLNVSNACDEAPISCVGISVQSIPSSVLTEVICEGECFALTADIDICEAGSYEYNFPTDLGCDSIVFVDLTVFEAGETQLSAVICEGDSLFIGDRPYFTTDVHTTILENYLGCDSTVVLDLTTVICEIEGLVNEVPIVCNGESNGQIVFSITSGTPPFSYSWQQLGGSANGNGTIDMLNVDANIINLGIGTYLVTINDDFGNDLILIQEVTEPDLLVASIETSDYNGFGVSCPDGTDGSLTVVPGGGVPPYDYLWSNGATASSIDALSAGNYAVQLTDAAGCLRTFETLLTSPSSLQAEVLFSDPDCTGGDSGFIEVLNVSGGTAPYLFSLNGGTLQAESNFPGLGTGTYTLVIEDANGCQLDTTSQLNGRIIPFVEAGADTLVDLGEQLQLRPLSDVPLDDVVWQPEVGLSCTACPFPVAMPLTTTIYTLAVTSEDGCTTVDSVQIRVNEVRDVFVPNAFSPNNDGVNDRLLIFGGPEVVRIHNFRVFNRWGDLVYERAELLPNAVEGTWDGRFGGELLGGDVYVWSADIEFIDGQRLPYAGDVLLLP